MAETLLPNYLLSADNHNIGNFQATWLNPESWGKKLGDGGKLIATSMLSGANSFYNTAVTVGNWFGADLTEQNTQRFVSSIDSDLGRYYGENTGAADFGGFILGSIVPGLGGIKLFNAGQTALKVASKGQVGTNLSRATALLVPKTEKYINESADVINSSLSAYKLMNAKTIQALGAGIYQNVLEGVAFETAVQATMFKSPILEDQDGWDIIKNVAVGGAFSGVVGGAFAAAKTFGILKQAVKAEDEIRIPISSRPKFAEITSPSERIILLAEDSAMGGAVPVPFTGKFALDTALYNLRLTKNSNDIRTSIHDLTSKDRVLANIVANVSVDIPHTKILENFLGVEEITRLNTLSKAEQAIQKATKAGEPVPKNYANRYVKLIGEGSGDISTEAPRVKTLGDLYKDQAAIRAAVLSEKFSINTLWDPLKEITRAEAAYLQAEKRHIWAQDILKEIKPGTIIHEFDIPLLERAYKDSMLDFKLSVAGGLEYKTVASKQELYKYLKDAKEYVALKLAGRKNFKENIDAISVITNTRESYLNGIRSADESYDLFKMQSEKIDYEKAFTTKKLSTSVEEFVDPKYLPKYGKLTYNIDKFPAENLDAIVFFKEKQKLYEESARRVGAKILGSDIINSLPRITDSALITASRIGSGPGLISGENSNYGTLGSIMAFLGGRSKAAKEAQRLETQQIMEGPLSRLGSKPEAAIEFDAIDRQISRSGTPWILHEQNDEKFLITKRALKEHGERENLTTVHDTKTILGKNVIVNIDAVPESDMIRFSNLETRQAVEEHITRSGTRTSHHKDIRAAQGHQDVKDPNVYRPIRPDFRDYPFFAFVRDPKVTGTGHMTMIHAASEKELTALVDRVPPQYEVLFKRETEEFKAARGEYDSQRTLHDNYIDADLKNRGVMSNFFPKASPQKIVDDILKQHLREDDILIYETMRLVYEPQFNWLQDMGEQYARASTSKFASFTESVEKTVDNPFFNQIKTALDISKASEYPILYSFNRTLDSAVSKFVGVVRDTFSSVKSTAELNRVNAVLDKYGMKPAFLPAYDAGMYELANHHASKGELTKFVRGANAVLGRLVLGLDPLNALNNGIGANILRNTELNHLLNAIKEGDSAVASDLAKLSKVQVPGTEDLILSHTKLTSQAITNFFKDEGNVLINKYKQLGFIKDRLEQFKLIVDDFTLTGTETVPQLQKRLDGAFQKAKALVGETKEGITKIANVGEKVTGNTFVEEFNRFLSANVMDQITSIGVKHNLLTQAEALTYINTFVNRVEGNIIASQRPLIFQGPIGQAIGLFQSYQFNLLQQLFRYVAEGGKKDLAMLVGLQTTLYGAQSLPAFQFINTHIVGTLSGNQNHKDLYDQTYGTLGKTAGEFLMYGLPSNILHANIYSRGDINPRQVTIIPTNPQEVPIFAGWAKFFSSTKDTITKIGLGGNVWQSLLQGLEHNGISRPLAGLAQIMQASTTGQVIATSSKDSILGSNDLLHWSSLVRLAGGRPIDEAITNDAIFRVHSYEAKRRTQLQDLSEAVKSSLIAGGEATTDQVNSFASRYVYLGGKQSQFNHWMMNLYKNANVPQADQLKASLSNPFAYKMQLLMEPNQE